MRRQDLLYMNYKSDLSRLCIAFMAHSCINFPPLFPSISSFRHKKHVYIKRIPWTKQTCLLSFYGLLSKRKFRKQKNTRHSGGEKGRVDPPSNLPDNPFSLLKCIVCVCVCVHSVCVCVCVCVFTLCLCL